MCPAQPSPLRVSTRGAVARRGSPSAPRAPQALGAKHCRGARGVAWRYICVKKVDSCHFYFSKISRCCNSSFHTFPHHKNGGRIGPRVRYLWTDPWGGPGPCHFCVENAIGKTLRWQSVSSMCHLFTSFKNVTKMAGEVYSPRAAVPFTSWLWLKTRGAAVFLPCRPCLRSSLPIARWASRLLLREVHEKQRRRPTLRTGP